MWNMRTAQVIPTVVGLLGSGTNNLDKLLEKKHNNYYFITSKNYITRKLKTRGF